MTPANLAQAILQDLPQGVVLFDRQLSVTLINRAGTDIFGPLQTADQLRISGTAPDRSIDWPAELRRVLQTGLPVRHDMPARPSHGQDERLLEINCTPLESDSTGQASGVIVTVADVTDRAGLERRLAVSERLAAVGRLAARVAHELNNPLDGILRYINMTLRLLEDHPNPKATTFLEESRRGLMRMAQILGELLEFSRSSPSQLDESDINRTVEDAVQTLQGQSKRTAITITTVFQQDDMPVLRGGMLFQVCCNLIKNALDAMPEGGRLTVTTAVVDGQVVLEFADTGPGLPTPIERIFEPFYTTKPPGQGTGLGLAICKDYIERLHGQITAANSPHGGAVFSVRIPLSSCVPNSRSTDS